MHVQHEEIVPAASKKRKASSSSSTSSSTVTSSKEEKVVHTQVAARVQQDKAGESEIKREIRVKFDSAGKPVEQTTHETERQRYQERTNREELQNSIAQSVLHATSMHVSVDAQRRLAKSAQTGRDAIMQANSPIAYRDVFYTPLIPLEDTYARLDAEFAQSVAFFKKYQHLIPRVQPHHRETMSVETWRKIFQVKHLCYLLPLSPFFCCLYFFVLGGAGAFHLPLLERV